MDNAYVSSLPATARRTAAPAFDHPCTRNSSDSRSAVGTPAVVALQAHIVGNHVSLLTGIVEAMRSAPNTPDLRTKARAGKAKAALSIRRRLSYFVSLLAALQGSCLEEQGIPTQDLGALVNREQMYSLKQIPRFAIELDTKAWQSLREQPREYVRARFRYRDEVYEDVGVRLKGNLSFLPIDEKPSFKIKFNKFIRGRRFLGVESLTLNNMKSDASKLHEWIGYRLFRELGVPASRAGYARLSVNQENYGLYLNLETLDDAFLEDRFQDPRGNLYEGEHGDDLDDDLEDFELDEGEDFAHTELIKFAQLAQQDDDSVFFDNATVLDTQAFLAFSFAESYAGHFDGYWVSHNYFLYHDPGAHRWYYMPWSLDQTFVRSLNPFQAKGFLTKKCRETQSCLEHYVAQAMQWIDHVEKLELLADIDRIAELIEPELEQDGRMPHSLDRVHSAQESVREFIERRPAEMRDMLDCLVDGEEPDLDGDGYGPCFRDCNDNDAEIHISAKERCDGIDNDCSEYADDDPACPCPSEIVDGQEFFFCDFDRKWRDALDFCEEQGHDLVRFDSQSQNDAVWKIAQDINPGRWTLGLNDRDEENTYLWSDGSKPSFSRWADGEPAHSLDWFDCVYFGSSSNPTWIERNCSTTAPFICVARETRINEAP